MQEKTRSASPMNSINRRNFLKTAGAAVVLPTILPSSVLGRGGKAPPSGKITMGVIGWGSQGPGDAQSFYGQDDCQMVAACDVDKNRLRTAVNTINRHYGNTDCASYHDYRELLARPDMDAVMIAVPDNWHALVATEAASHGLDIYGEKPLARTIAEQQAIVKAVQENNLIWQTGSWQRSQASFHKAAEIVRNGLIGDITRVEVGLPGGSGRRPAGINAEAGSAPGQDHQSFQNHTREHRSLEARRQRAAAGIELRHVDRSGADGALHRGARPL